MTDASRTMRLAAAAVALCVLGAVRADAQAVDLDEPDATVGATVVELDPTADSRIAERLRTVFSVLDSLAGVSVDVRSGIVILTGTVPSSRDFDLAEVLATRTEGVIAVDNRIATGQTLSERVDGLLADLRSRAAQSVAVAPVVLLAAVVLIAAWWLSRGAGVLAGGALVRSRNPFLGRVVRQIVSLAVFIGGLIVVLNLFDAGTLVGSVLGGLGLIGLAVGFAVRDTLENYLASLLLSFRQPFAPGEHVVIDGVEGRVSRLTSRATILIDFDGNHIRLPNSTVFKGTIRNFDRNPLRRFSFKLGIDPDAAVSRARAVALEALNDTDGVLADPAPVVLFDEFGDWANVLCVFAWVDQRKTDFGLTRTHAMTSIRSAFIAADIAMPLPTYDVQTRAESSGGSPADDAETPLDADELTTDDPAAELSKLDSGPDLLSPDAPRE